MAQKEDQSSNSEMFIEIAVERKSIDSRTNGEELEKGGTTTSALTDGEDVPFTWTFDIITNLLALWACFFSSTWMLVVPSSTIGFISQAFPEDADKAIWIATSVVICNTVIQSFNGKLTDTLDRRYFIMSGPFLCIIGSLVSGRADSMNMVIGGQVLSGVGLTMGYLAIPFTVEVVPKQKRPYVQGISGLFAGIAYSSGGPIAGAFIKHDVGGANNGWRGGFYIGAGLNAVAFVLLVFFYHPLPRQNPEGLSLWKRAGQIDWLGVFLVAAGLTIFLVGLEYGGNAHPWTSAIVIAPMVVGFVCLVAFVLWEWIGTDRGLVDHRLFAHRNFGLTLVLNFVSGMVFFGGQAYIPQEIIALFTSDAVLTGVYTLPFNVTTIVGGIVGGLVMAVTREGRTTVVGSYVVLLVGAGLMAIMQPHYNFAAWFFPAALLGTAVGIQTALLIIVVSICTPNHLIATASNVAAATRGFGGSIGVVIFNQIFTSKVKTLLPAAVAPAVLKAGLPATSLRPLLEAVGARSDAALQSVPGISMKIIQALTAASEQAYADSFRFVWYSLLPFAALSLILSWFLRSTKAQMTQQIAAGIEHRH